MLLPSQSMFKTVVPTLSLCTYIYIPRGFYLESEALYIYHEYIDDNECFGIFALSLQRRLGKMVGVIANTLIDTWWIHRCKLESPNWAQSTPNVGASLPLILRTYANLLTCTLASVYIKPMLEIDKVIGFITHWFEVTNEIWHDHVCRLESIAYLAYTI